MNDDKQVVAMAISLIKTGDKARGANILANLLITNPNNEAAWLWLAFCADTNERKEYCLKRAMQINPNRVEVQQALNELRGSTSSDDERAISKSPKIEMASPVTTENDKPTPVQPQYEKETTSKTRLEKAIDLIQAGKNAEGANILSNLLSLDPNIEEAWYWLSICADSTERKIYCLEKVLAINPERDDARQLLQELSNPEGGEISPGDDFMPTRSEARLETERAPSKPVSNQKRKDQFDGKVLAGANAVDKTKARAGAAAKVKAEAPGKTNVDDRAQDKTDTKARDKAEVQAKIKVLKQPDSQDSNAEKNTSSSKDVKGKRKMTRIEDPLIEPTYSIVQPDDNMFAERKDRPYKFPLIEGYGNSLFIDGVRINSFSRPRCLKVGFILDDARCELCDFFSSQECIFREDPFLFEDALMLAAGKRDLNAQHKERRKTVIRAIYGELQAHGRPLHYTVLAQIVAERYPHLKLSKYSVLGMMKCHPEIFENLGEGAFQCKQRER
jgi:hypothetical protein